MSKFQVGDLCITQNAEVSLLNNGLLVVIVEIDPTRNGGATPYLIRRIDGQKYPCTYEFESGVTQFYFYTQTWSSQHKLRRIDPDETSDYVEKTKVLNEPA